jgi:hypothetical protein
MEAFPLPNIPFLNCLSRFIPGFINSHLHFVSFFYSQDGDGQIKTVLGFLIVYAVDDHQYSSQLFTVFPFWVTSIEFRPTSIGQI